MARGDAQWAALDDALHDTIPPCDGDIRFVLDTPTGRDLEDMSALCDACPLKALCAAYADVTRPSGTYWAGKFYPPAKETTNG